MEVQKAAWQGGFESEGKVIGHQAFEMQENPREHHSGKCKSYTGNQPRPPWGWDAKCIVEIKEKIPSLGLSCWYFLSCSWVQNRPYKIMPIVMKNTECGVACVR
ncbi:hypothetical protein AA18895_2399 [Acetobacter ghanensis DSM 18895]|nr:hypothetical protein AA18895_2399 [Acetobacter ghanensis DSM 18895]